MKVTTVEGLEKRIWSFVVHVEPGSIGDREVRGRSYRPVSFGVKFSWSSHSRQWQPCDPNLISALVRKKDGSLGALISERIWGDLRDEFPGIMAWVEAKLTELSAQPAPVTA
jgi:hypothetical protein